MSIYSFVKSFPDQSVRPRGGDRLVMVVTMFAVAFVYDPAVGARAGKSRQRDRARLDRPEKPAPDCAPRGRQRPRAPGPGKIMVFPILLDGRDGEKPHGRLRLAAAVVPDHAGELQGCDRRDLFWSWIGERPDHRQRGRVSLVVAFLAAVALAKFHFYGRKAFIVGHHHRRQMIPLNALSE